MPDFLSLSLRDRSNEPSGMRIRMRDNYADDATRDAAYIAMENAVLGLSKGNPISRKISTDTRLGNGASTDPLAKREVKILVKFYDNVTYKAYSQEIPIAEFEDVTYVSTNSDELVLEDGDIVEAFVTAWEANVETEAQNLTTITSMEVVGRNL